MTVNWPGVVMSGLAGLAFGFSEPEFGLPRLTLDSAKFGFALARRLRLNPAGLNCLGREFQIFGINVPCLRIFLLKIQTTPASFASVFLDTTALLPRTNAIRPEIPGQAGPRSSALLPPLPLPSSPSQCSDTAIRIRIAVPRVGVMVGKTCEWVHFLVGSFVLICYCKISSWGAGIGDGCVGWRYLMA